MFEPQEIPEVVLVKPKRFGDDRGFFSETFRADAYDEAGVKGPFVQDNHSLSKERGVIRGLHFQKPPHPQAKLVRCTRGAVIDVAVDIRKGSPHFGRHVAVELSAENGWQLFVPVGFAHGFATLTENAEVQYKVTDYYARDCDAGVAFDDPDLGVNWGLGDVAPILSDKDRNMPPLKDVSDVFEYVAP